MDEPHCGYDGSACPRPQGLSQIMAVILGVILVFGLLMKVWFYRRWKTEQEITGLLWRIDIDCLDGGLTRGMHHYPSRQSLASAYSGGSDGYLGGQCRQARYKGALVRFKELEFEKRKDIARDIMKEMKLMREVRHPNINSFIGAHVEPQRIILLTDFCSKGALQDILENPDIKLDLMFIASLVTDLVSGLHFLHYSTQLGTHGNLRSSNCLVTSRWTLQIADFGLHELRASAEDVNISEDNYNLIKVCSKYSQLYLLS